MSGRTHWLGGSLSAFLGFYLLVRWNLLHPNINPILQLIIVYPFAIWGSMAPDLDHHWNSAPMRDLPSLIINKVLHLTTSSRKFFEKNNLTKGFFYKVSGLFDARHRSWQTHSDLSLAVLLLVLYGVNNNFFLISYFSGYDYILINLVLVGAILGFISHIFLDALTSGGVWCLWGCLLNRLFKTEVYPTKYHLVPRSTFFATNSDWEAFVSLLVRLASVIMFFIVLQSLYFPELWVWVEAKVPYIIEVN